ncbi:MAG: RnfABCDGE type electron transport complex subunit D [Eubacterium sp.]|nr:RnfABCDGE type electron transport complex subunit D [Eubacterium sp.]
MYHVSSSPHVKAKMTTQSIMRDVIIALLPATIFGIYNNSNLFGIKYGIHSALLILVTVITCVGAEYIYNKITDNPISIFDLSAVVTGMILALNLPCTFPYWKAALGGAFAIIIVKQLFGGLGQNFMNPALGARCFLMLSFAGNMTAFYPADVSGVDAATSATPLTALKNIGGSSSSLLEMFVGTHAGTIGETSIIALLIGALYLTVRKIIDLRIPLTYIAVFVVCIMLFNKSTDINFLAMHLCGGGLIFGAFFMATDYSTSPITKTGRYFFGICLGLLTAVFRTFGNTAEGVSYAIIFCNLLVPLIEKWSIPKAFGIVKKKGGR